MGLLDTLRKRSSAVRFSFSFALHALSPWPASSKAIAIAWQRGSKKKKRGVTDAHRPRQVQGQLGTVIEFNEVIQISATLYMENNVSPTPSGPFKKKCLILAVIESSGPNGRDTNALGRVVIDLSQFAAMTSETEVEFPVACSRNIVAAVGEPQLGTTIKCMWKTSGGPASMASSMSSDKTGGTFTTNFSAFIRGNENEQIPVRLTGEQFDDLRGFDRLNTIKECEHDYPPRSSRRRNSRNSRDSHLRTQTSDGFVVEDFVPSPTAGQRCTGETGGEGCCDVEQAYCGVIAEEKTTELSAAVLKTHERRTSHDSELPSPEFRFGGQSRRYSDISDNAVLTQDRTGAWLSDLGADVPAESPTCGLVYQGSTTAPAAPEETPESVAHDSPIVIAAAAVGATEEKGDLGEKDDSDSVSTASPVLERITDGGSEDILSSTEIFGHTSVRKESTPEKNQPLNNHSTNLTPDVHNFQQETRIAASKSNEKSSVERRWKRTTALTEDPAVTEARRSASPNRPGLPGRIYLHSSPERTPSPINGTPVLRDAPPAPHLMAELQSSTFLEYSVYLARPSPQKYTPRSVHASARRIARTLNLIGSDGEECVSLLQSALQAIRVMVESSGVDIPSMAFWWGNCFQLRRLLSLPEGRERSRSPSPERQDWSLHRMHQLIVKMEKSIFDRLQQHLWLKIFVPHVAMHDSKVPQYKEDGVHKWLHALSAVHEQFALPNSSSGGEIGHLHLLRRKIIGNCCRMMDSLLFRELLSGATQGEFAFEPLDSLQADMTTSQPRSWPKVHPSSLPFKKGPLTFGVGMHLKMAVTRWSEWAIEANMKESQHIGDPGQSFFPSLKASADLLMMPKELLTDASVRGELFAALSIRSMCILLEKFQPDEFAPDPVNPDVLLSLSARLKESHDGGSALSLVLQEPPFDCKYDASDSDPEMETAFDSESEAEIDSIVKTFQPTHGTVSRFELLKSQWLSSQRDKR